MHNLQNYTEAYKTHNHIYNDKKLKQRNTKKIVRDY